MATEKKPLDPATVAKDLAHQLGWEFWIIDHKDIVNNVILTLLPDGDPTGLDTPQRRHLEIKNALKEKRDAMDLPKPDPKELEETNRWWKMYWNEKRMDTVAIGVKGNNIYIAANVKKRNTRQGIEKGTDEIAPENLGLHGGRHDDLIRKACAQYNKQNNANYTYTLLFPEKAPKTKVDNSERHAEMQIYAYLSQQNNNNNKRTDLGKDLGIDAIGVSKPLCGECSGFAKEKDITAVANSRYYLGEPTVAEVRDIVEAARLKAETAVKAIRKVLECRRAMYKAEAELDEASKAAAKFEKMENDESLVADKFKALKAKGKAEAALVKANNAMEAANRARVTARRNFDTARERANLASSNPEDFVISVPPGNWLNPLEGKFGTMAARRLLG